MYSLYHVSEHHLLTIRMHAWFVYIWDNWHHANRIGECSDVKLHLFKIVGKGEGHVTHGILG